MANRDLKSGEAPKLSSELKLIPRWSVLLAVLAFAGVEYLFWIVIPQHRHHPGPPVGMRIYFAVTWGALAALYMLMSVPLSWFSRWSERRLASGKVKGGSFA